MLPDSNANEPASHGFITYKLNAKNGLIPGTILSDHAEIYFDFNTAIATNYTNVQMVATTNLSENNEYGRALMISPNPVTGAANLIFAANAGDNVTITIYDAKGSKVISQLFTSSWQGAQKVQLDCTGLRGLYTVELQTPSTISQSKMIVVDSK